MESDLARSVSGAAAPSLKLPGLQAVMQRVRPFVRRGRTHAVVRPADIGLFDTWAGYLTTMRSTEAAYGRKP